MELRKANTNDCLQIMEWVNNPESIAIWAGPGFRYPFTEVSFIEDINLLGLESYCLDDGKGSIVAFGQLYNRLDRCHLGRLIVNPNQRYQGIGEKLIRALIVQGQQVLGFAESSLFVLENNIAALNLYKKLGFEVTPYPEEQPLANCLYMVKK